MDGHRRNNLDNWDDDDWWTDERSPDFWDDLAWKQAAQEVVLSPASEEQSKTMHGDSAFMSRMSVGEHQEGAKWNEDELTDGHKSWRKN